MGWLQSRVMQCLRVKALPEPTITCYPGGFLRESANKQSCANMCWLQSRVMQCLRVKALPEPTITCYPGGFLRESANKQSCAKRRPQLQTSSVAVLPRQTLFLTNMQLPLTGCNNLPFKLARVYRNEGLANLDESKRLCFAVWCRATAARRWRPSWLTGAQSHAIVCR